MTKIEKLIVPKKVDRHVFKALQYLSGKNENSRIGISDIISRVKHQMRRLKAVPNINKVIKKSLENYTKSGTVRQHTVKRFKIDRKKNLKDSPPVEKNLPKIIDKKNEHDKECSLDPNKDRRCLSEESLSGDEIARTRKRQRSNNRSLKIDGRSTVVPPARRQPVTDSFHLKRYQQTGNSIKKPRCNYDNHMPEYLTLNPPNLNNYECTNINSQYRSFISVPKPLPITCCSNQPLFRIRHSNKRTHGKIGLSTRSAAMRFRCPPSKLHCNQIGATISDEEEHSDLSLESVKNVDEQNEESVEQQPMRETALSKNNSKEKKVIDFSGNCELGSDTLATGREPEDLSKYT